MSGGAGAAAAEAVVRTGVALGKARAWLGLAPGGGAGGAPGGGDDDLVEDDCAVLEARQARLGLGARFLPHNAAVQDPLRRVLGGKALRTRARREEEEAQAMAGGGESDSEDEGRGRAIVGRGTAARGARGAAREEQDLLAAVAAPKRRKRRRKGGKGAGGGVAAG